MSKEFLTISDMAQNTAQAHDGNILKSTEYQNAEGVIPIPFGKRQDNSLIIYDIHDIPHILVCGVSGSGKTAFIQTILGIIVNRTTYNDARFIIFDSKLIEYVAFGSLPFMYMPIITSSDELQEKIVFIASQVKERLTTFAAVMKKDLDSYNEWLRSRNETPIPELFVVIDDLAEAKLNKEAEDAMSDILRNGRIAGIHLILISSVTSARILKKEYIFNIPCKIAFCLASKAESKLILETAGAETLNIPGEMIIKNQSIMEKCQCVHAEPGNIDNAMRSKAAKEKTNLESLRQMTAGIFTAEKDEEQAAYDDFIADAGALIILNSLLFFTSTVKKH